MNKLRKKLNKQGGFTLIEMLIVVAIIAILVAISIPLVNSTLEKARDATDQANERAAKAEVLLHAMEVTTNDWGTVAEIDTGTGKGKTYYNAQNGSVQKDKADITGYGKCRGGDDCYQSDHDHTDQIIEATYDPDDGSVTIVWVAP